MGFLNNQNVGKKIKNKLKIKKILKIKTKTNKKCRKQESDW